MLNDRIISKVIAVPRATSGNIVTSHISLPRAPWDPAPEPKPQHSARAAPRIPDDIGALVLDIITGSEPLSVYDVARVARTRGYKPNADKVRATLAQLCKDRKVRRERKAGSNISQFVYSLVEQRDA